MTPLPRSTDGEVLSRIGLVAVRSQLSSMGGDGVDHKNVHDVLPDLPPAKLFRGQRGRITRMG
jgi:hypothetical protein